MEFLLGLMLGGGLGFIVSVVLTSGKIYRGDK